MPGLHLSPFLPFSTQAANHSIQGMGNEIEVLNANPSLFEPEDDVAGVGFDNSIHADMSQENSVLQQYILDMVAAGKSQFEVTREIENYFSSLTQNCDSEI